MTSVFGGEVPSTWSVVPLNEIASVEYGKAKPKSDGPFPVIGSGGEYGRAGQALVKHPTIVVGRKGTAGRVWLSHDPCWPSDTTFYLDWKSEVDIDFVYAALLARPIRGLQGDVLPSLKRPDLEKFEIPLPPLPEQRAIAHVLRAVQQAKEATEQVIAAARELKRSLIRYLFTYGPVRVDQADEVDLVETRYGRLRADWQVTDLADVAQISVGAPFKSERFSDTPAEGAMPLIRIRDIPQGTEGTWIAGPFEDETLERYSINPGDVLIGMDGQFHVGRWRGSRGLLNQRVATFKVSPDSESLFDFLAYAVADPIRRIEEEKHYTTVRHLSMKDLRGLPVPRPSSGDQNHVVKILKSIDRRVAAEEAELDALVTLFDSLLHDLVTAKLRLADLEVSA